MKHVRAHSYFDWRLIDRVNFEDYLWWSYPNFKRNDKFEIFADSVDLKTDNGLPKCIIRIVEMINISTYFIKEIRRFAWVLTWNQKFLIIIIGIIDTFIMKKYLEKRNF